MSLGALSSSKPDVQIFRIRLSHGGMSEDFGRDLICKKDGAI
jgi:hypothetical protein